MAAGGSAGYRTRTGPPAAEGNPGRLRRYPRSRTRQRQRRRAPNPGRKGRPVQRGAGQRRRHRGKLRRCVESGLIEPVRLCNYAAAPGLPRIGPRRAASVKKGPSRASTLRARKKGCRAGRQGRRPSASLGRKARKYSPLSPPERRAMPPAKLPNSGIPGRPSCRASADAACGVEGGREEKAAAAGISSPSTPPPRRAACRARRPRRAGAVLATRPRRAVLHARAAHGSRRIAVHFGRIPARQESSARPNASMTRFAPAWCSRTSSKVTWTYRPCALLFLFSTMIL